MKLFKYWSIGHSTAEADGRTIGVNCYGGSNESSDDALRCATALAERKAQALRVGERQDAYLYSDRPLREEIIEEVETYGERTAVITRNAYGSLVLNTSRVLFADIDLPPSALRRKKRGLLGFLTESQASPPPGDDVLTRLGNVATRELGLGMRVYRTAKGFRCLVTSGTYDPTAATTRALLESLGSDPLFIELCRVQECFRARLTAKYWRCGAPAPPFRFPWPEGDFEPIYRAWERAYHAQADRYTACVLERTFGTQVRTPEVERIIAVHDHFACREGAELA